MNSAFNKFNLTQKYKLLLFKNKLFMDLDKVKRALIQE